MEIRSTNNAEIKEKKEQELARKKGIERDKENQQKEIEKAVSGESYTGIITEINKTQVLQQVRNRTISHNRAALSGLNKFNVNDKAEIKYPSGNAGIVKEPKQEAQYNKNKSYSHDVGSRER